MLKVISQRIGELYDLRRNGRLKFRGSYNDCLKKLQQESPHSWDHSLKHEGWTIEPTVPDWKEQIAEI